MSQLSELQVEFISNEISALGVHLEELHGELLDHICTAIELRMDAGEEFESAFQSTIKLFGPGGLMQVQEHTLLLTTKLSEKMQKFSSGLGLAATALLLAGMFFKVMHWPGAGILLLTGNFTLVMVYLPILLYHKLRESDRKEYPVIVLGFVGLGLFAAGSTFKIMHWPMANIILTTGFALLTLGFLPLYFVRRYRSSANKSITVTTAMLTLVGALQVGQLLNLHNSRQHYQSIALMNEVMEENERWAAQNDQLVAALPGDERATQLVTESDTLVAHLEEMKTQLIMHVQHIGREEAQKTAVSELGRADDFTNTSVFLAGHTEQPVKKPFTAAALALKLDAFRATVLASYPEAMQPLVEPTLGLRTDGTYAAPDGQTLDWSHYHFYNVTLVSALTHLSKIQWEVRQAQNAALISLKAQSEAPRPPSAEA